MKILVVGASGTIGSLVVRSLKEKGHEILEASLHSQEYPVDTHSSESIKNLFQKIGTIDAVIATAGIAHLGPLAELEENHFYTGLKSKLMGQVNLVLFGKDYLKQGGSFTLTSGILAEDPIMGGVACSVVDAAINGFVRAAANELKNDLRLNAVAPGVVENSKHLHQYFPGHIPVSMDRVVAAYLKCVYSGNSGDIVKVY